MGHKAEDGVSLDSVVEGFLSRGEAGLFRRRIREGPESADTRDRLRATGTSDGLPLSMNRETVLTQLCKAGHTSGRMRPQRCPKPTYDLAHPPPFFGSATPQGQSARECALGIRPFLDTTSDAISRSGGQHHSGGWGKRRLVRAPTLRSATVPFGATGAVGYDQRSAGLQRLHKPGDGCVWDCRSFLPTQRLPDSAQLLPPTYFALFIKWYASFQWARRSVVSSS